MESLDKLDNDTINLLNKHNVLKNLVNSVLLEKEISDISIDEKELIEYEQFFFKSRFFWN